MRILTVLLVLFFVGPAVLYLPAAYAATEKEDSDLDEIIVHARRIANDEPAGGVSTIATVLRFDPKIDLQSRGSAESQSDITVQGGAFENTGTKVGAVSVFDPQTGHYVADLPIAPGSLSAPTLRIGLSNAIAGFNATVATLEYELSKIQSGGHVGLGIGNHNLWSQTARLAVDAARSSGPGHVAGEITYAGSRGDGSVANGDHDFERFTVRGQLRDADRQSDLLLAYQDKFFGWPGAYTGFASLPETDHTKTKLLLVNHRQSLENGEWAIGAFYRALEDDYDFDRSTQETGVAGAFDHETRSFGIGFEGHRQIGNLNWHLSGQASGDELVRSTDLTEGDFTSRRYVSLRLAPEKRFSLKDDANLRVRAGLSLDYSNRDRDAVLPMLGVTVEVPTSSGLRRWSLEYAATSQVPGYTALKSRPSGLFGGNAALGRERADTVQLSFDWQSDTWTASARAFVRNDDDLVDWTYLSGAPFARQANAVDLDVSGLEMFWAHTGPRIAFAMGYSYLDKDADYGSATVDASFYALNYARHRVTLALTYRVLDALELRLDNEYRKQVKNPLRTNRDAAHTGSIGLVWKPTAKEGFRATLTVDNITDNGFQEFPGTPAVGRQARLGVRYDW